MEDEWGLVGPLPIAFFAAALVNFSVGSTLGFWMAARPSSWSTLAALHAEMNPWGWLTMAIFGMTYAVLSISAGLRLHPPMVGWVHLFIAELGIAFIVTGYAVGVAGMVHVGVVAQAFSPLVFLTNILLALRAKRRGLVSIPAIPEHLRPLGRREDCVQTDRVARRGTDLSGMLLAASAVWSCTAVLWLDEGSRGANMLLYYGWLVGTVASVSLHFYPRLVGDVTLPVWPFRFFQAVWFPAAVVLALGNAINLTAFAGTGRILMGSCLVWIAVVYLTLLARRRCFLYASLRAMLAPRVTVLAWFVGYVYAGIAGALMLAGWDSDALPVLHALFLGWMTTMVYGTSYAVMPLLFGVTFRSQPTSSAQLWTSVIGTALVISAFLNAAAPASQILLAVGGGLAWLAFVWFLVRTGCSMMRSRLNRSVRGM
ncbi:hypothetical protein [Alicyclobacillus fructus]|uniref:hypothetical protein n=1 Tax=Alicyclobacillus fructus TaxID=2816082 RepID=UPI001A8D8902|nr:hypothetical protein [Alicyclobacillus fructus]